MTSKEREQRLSAALNNLACDRGDGRQQQQPAPRPSQKTPGGAPIAPDERRPDDRRYGDEQRQGSGDTDQQSIGPPGR